MSAGARRTILRYLALEGGSGLGRHIGAAGGQIRIQRVAEILHAASAVGEVRALHLAAAAMAGGDGPERLVGFADRVEPLALVGARRVHGKIAGILDDALSHLLQVKRPRPLQHHAGDLPVVVANVAAQPARNLGRLLLRKRRRRAANGNGADEAKAPDKVHS